MRIHVPVKSMSVLLLGLADLCLRLIVRLVAKFLYRLERALLNSRLTIYPKYHFMLHGEMKHELLSCTADRVYELEVVLAHLVQLIIDSFV